MPKFKSIGLFLVVVIFGILFIPKIIDRLQKDTVVQEGRSLSAKPLAYISLNGEAKRVPEFTFLNQDSLFISNEDFNNKVYVVEFFFTTCPSICPIMTQNLRQVQSAFADESGISLVSITINPAYDTPEVLANYAQKYDITHPNWYLLTGDQEMIYQMANKGFNLYVGPGSEVDGGFEHSGFFALVDRQGNIRSRFDQYGNPIIYYDGLELAQVSKLINDIRVLLKEKG
jgi:protein SCO1/2